MMFQRVIDRARACIDYTTRYQTIVIPNLGVMNRNSRIYTKETAKAMIGGPFENMFGQIGHPENDTVNLKNASHIIYGTFLVGNDLWAEYSIIDSSHGRLLYDLLQNGDFVLRPRGYGTVEHDGTVGPGYRLISFDFIPVEEDTFKETEHG